MKPEEFDEFESLRLNEVPGFSVIDEERTWLESACDDARAESESGNPKMVAFADELLDVVEALSDLSSDMMAITQDLADSVVYAERAHMDVHEMGRELFALIGTLADLISRPLDCAGNLIAIAHEIVGDSEERP